MVNSDTSKHFKYLLMLDDIIFFTQVAGHGTEVQLVNQSSIMGHPKKVLLKDHLELILLVSLPQSS